MFVISGGLIPEQLVGDWGTVGGDGPATSLWQGSGVCAVLVLCASSSVLNIVVSVVVSAVDMSPELSGGGSRRFSRGFHSCLRGSPSRPEESPDEEGMFWKL